MCNPTITVSAAFALLTWTACTTVPVRPRYPLASARETAARASSARGADTVPSAAEASLDGAASATDDRTRKAWLLERRACVGDATSACYLDGLAADEVAATRCMAAGVGRCEERYKARLAAQARLRPLQDLDVVQGGKRSVTDPGSVRNPDNGRHDESGMQLLIGQTPHTFNFGQPHGLRPL